MLRLLGLPTSFGVGLFPSKAFLVLTFVVLSQNKCISRKEVAQYIWGDVSVKKAFSNLRYVLSKIRNWERLNNTKLFDISPKTISLNENSPKVDVETLLNLSQVNCADVLEQIRELYRGNLLSSIDLVDETGQELLASARLRVLNRVIEIALESSRKTVGEKVELALEKLSQLAPFDEAILRARIRNLCLTGRKDFAKNLFRKFQSKLHKDMGCEVEESTLGLASQLLPIIFATPRARLVPKMEQRRSELPRVLLLPPAQDPFNQTSRLERALARGLLDEVSTLLGRMRTFSIIAPHTANQLENLDYSSAADKVNADYVVRSTAYVAHASNKYSSLDFKLIHIKTQECLLSEVVQLDHRNLARLHAEIAETIANSITSSISSNEVAQFESTGNSSAYVHYVLGQQKNGYELGDARNAKKHFQKALHCMPSFSSAYAGLARTQTNEWLILHRTGLDLLKQSKKNAAKAIELDPTNPMGNWEFGHSNLYLGELDDSLAQFDKALVISPNFADIIAEQADVYLHKGNCKKAADLMKKAIELNPMPPDSYLWNKATTLFINEDYQASMATFQSMENTILVERLMAACAAMIGNYSLAEYHRGKWLQNFPNFKLRDWLTGTPGGKSVFAGQFIEAFRRAGFT